MKNFSLYRNFLFGKRLRLIMLNSLNNLASPISTLFISLLVVRLISIATWGEYAKIILLITLLTQITSWGNKEYLIREFSKNPSLINSIWMESIISRCVLLLPVFIFVFFTPYDFISKCYIIVIVILRFILQSYDCLIFYQRNYLIKIISEFSYGILFGLAIICFHEKLRIIHLVFFTVLLDTFKTVAIIIVKRNFFIPTLNQITTAYLKKSFLFFLLGSTGLIISRVDQISASLFLDSSDMGKYQIIMSFLLIILTFSNYILQPFLKNIYRSKFAIIKKISLKLLLLGVFISAAGIILMNYILLLFYHIEIGYPLLLMCYLFVLPIFYYAAYIFTLLKIGRVDFVIIMNLSGSILTFVLSLTLMHMYGKSLYAILSSAVITQFILLIVYPFFTNIKQQSYQ